MTPKEKGSALEQAVRGIENVILRSSPALRENTFTIENNKIITADGVRHEIDVYVGVAIAAGYMATFIFECKNWEEAVGKNEIIVFAEKIRAASAQKGFFVAKSFTQGAEAQAALDSRIELLRVDEHPSADTVLPFGFHGIFQDRERMVSSLLFVESEPGPRTPPNPIQSATLNGAPFDCARYAHSWINEEVTTNLNAFQSQHLPAGEYQRMIEAERAFGVRELVINGKEIRLAQLRVTLPVRVYKPAVISHFEVATRGRVISLAPMSFGAAGEVAVQLIQSAGS